jgi:outer membrane autotransporter protein
MEEQVTEEQTTEEQIAEEQLMEEQVTEEQTTEEQIAEERVANNQTMDNFVEETAKEFSAEINDEVGGDISAAGAENTLALAATLDRIALLVDSGDIPASSELGQTLALMQALEDPVALIQAIKSLEPESGGAGSEGSKAAAGAVSAVISSRQASLRSNLYETGMVAGDEVSITGFWIQGYDKDTEQELREGIDGFDVDMYGVALGADAPVGERATVGLAISYAESQVDSTGIESNKMTIDSYQISSYVSFNEDDYYLDALVSYARNEYDGKRNLFGGLTANSDYAGDQYGIRARGGYPFVLASGLHVTPNTSIEYSYLKEESYQEDGAGNSGLDIGSQSLDALVLAAGVKVAYPFTTESDTTWMPDFHIEVRRDFIGDKVELDTNFIGVGGAGFSINGASVEQTAYKAGIGLRAWSQSSLSFMFRYDYTYKKDYNSQSLAATMRYSF